MTPQHSTPKQNKRARKVANRRRGAVARKVAREARKQAASKES